MSPGDGALTVELLPCSLISSGAGVLLLLHLFLHFASLHPGMAPKKEIGVDSVTALLLDPENMSKIFTFASHFAS